MTTENNSRLRSRRPARVHSLFTLSLVFAVCTFLGCGGSGRPALIEAQGQVTLDGEPVSDAQIFLQYTGEEEAFQRPVSAVTDDAGHFSLNAYPDDIGVPEGTYKLAIMKKEQVGELPENYNPELAQQFRVKYRWTVPKKYSTLESSGLTLEVTSEGLQPAVIELSTDGKPPQEEFIGGRRATDA